MKKNKQKVSEGVLDSSSDDGWTAKSQLYKLAQYSIELHKMLRDDEELPGWVQAKITRASDSVSSVKHFLEYDRLSPSPESESLPVSESLTLEDQAMDFYTSIKSKINSQADHNAANFTEDSETFDFKVSYKTPSGEVRKKKVKASSQEDAIAQCKTRVSDGCEVLKARKQ